MPMSPGMLGLSLVRGGALTAYDYYIDDVNGSDSNNGRSPATAWASLSKFTSSEITVGGTTRVLVKAGTYDKSTDYFYLNGSSGWDSTTVVEITLEAGCTLDGTATDDGVNGYDASGGSWVLHFYGNGVWIRNYGEIAAGTENGFGNRGSQITYAYDVNIENCVDGFTSHDTSRLYIYDSLAQSCYKASFIPVGSSYIEAHRSYFRLDSTSTQGSGTETVTAKLYDCTIDSTATSRLWSVRGMEMVRCIVGGAVTRVNLQTTGTAAGTLTDCYVNAVFGGDHNISLLRCFGKISTTIRTGGVLQSIKKCVLSGPASSQIINGLADLGGCSPLEFSDNIIKTATASAFMSVTATVAAQIVSAGADFFNNILWGSAAYDADLIAADSGHTVIVGTITSDPLIGAANTQAMADYAFGTGSPAIGAGADGGNIGFGASDVVAVGAPA